MKEFLPVLYVYHLCALFCSTYVYLSNDKYEGKFIGVLFAGYFFVLVAFVFCYVIGAVYHCIESWSNK